jgi:hypothetical protein
MAAIEILQEARKLQNVSDSLGVLAGQHAPISEALTLLSDNVRDSAILLEVLVTLKLGSLPEYDREIN